MRALSVLLLSVAPGCTWVGDARYFDEVQDVDGDGVLDSRFGGPDCDDHDPSVGRCDRDGDGARDLAAGGDDCDDRDPRVRPGAPEVCDGVDDDCDGLVDDVDPDVVGRPTWYRDADGDGHGDAGSAVESCDGPPPGFVQDALDCDDGDADVAPGAPEFCGPVDENCDGNPEAGAVDRSDWVDDGDGDGYGAADGPVRSNGCSAEVAGTVPAPADGGADCDDADPAVHPGAAEVWYDGVDQDCDGADDADADGDGSPFGDDCDDADPAVHPGAPEVCDGVDDDCDRLVDDEDDDLSGALVTWYPDLDGDGRGAGAGRGFCQASSPAGWALTADDCDDRDASVRPGAPELCDGVDQNCNGALDDAAIDAVLWFVDADHDGHGTLAGAVLACAAPQSYVASGDDCDDADPETHPGADERCGDAVRQDCRPLPPDDCDGDGVVDVADCDPADPDVGPGLPEVCDGKDNDCDGLSDQADPQIDLSTARDWYQDLDRDTFGDPAHALTDQCTPPFGYVADGTDCDDLRDEVHPGTPEWCDGLDNDCDGFADDADPNGYLTDLPVWTLDLDGDGAGDDATARTGTCGPPDARPWVSSGGDCDDADPAVGPGAPETCGPGDEDCDGLVNDADPDVAGTVWYLDGDGDGWGSAGSPVTSCAQPLGAVAVAGDCDDFSAARNPGAAEICNTGVDDDCDGLADGADPDLAGSLVLYADADGDGFGDPATSVARCSAPAGYVPNANDCDDGDPRVSPAAIEVCNAVDDDCDGAVDTGPALVGPTRYADVDGDGFGDPDAPVVACGVGGGLVLDATDCDDADPALFPGQTLSVPTDRPDLASAVGAACGPGTIRLPVDGGTISTPLVSGDRELRIVGPAPDLPSNLHLDAGLADSPFLVTDPAGRPLTLESLHFEAGALAFPVVASTGAPVVLRDCSIEYVSAAPLSGAVARVDGGSLEVEGGRYADTDTGSLFEVVGGFVSLRDLELTRNTGSPAGPAILSATDAEVVLSGLDVTSATGSGGSFGVHGGSLVATGLWIADSDAAFTLDGDVGASALGDLLVQRSGPLVLAHATGAVTVHDSRFEEAAGLAAIVVTGGGTTNLQWNQVLASAQHGVSTGGATTNLLANTFAEGGDTLVDVTGGSAVVIYSALWRSSGDAVSNSGGAVVADRNLRSVADGGVGGPNDARVADPLFQTWLGAPVDSWDLHSAGTCHPDCPLEDTTIPGSDPDGSAPDFGAWSLTRFQVWYDGDGDGMGDDWARHWFGSAAVSAAGDPDGDGASNALEWANGTDPTNADTDSDGVLDGLDGPLH